MGLERLQHMGLEKVSDGSGRLKLPSKDAEFTSKGRRINDPRTHLLVDFGFRDGENRGFHLTPAITNVTVNPDKPVAWVNQRQLDLTPREHAILAFISEREGVAIPHEAIYEKVWNKPMKVGNVRTQTYFLRRFFGNDVSKQAIQTTSGGIRFGDFDPTRYFDTNTGEVAESHQVEIFGGKLTFYPESKGVQINDRVVELTSQEADLMTLFVHNVNVTISRESIHEVVFGEEAFSAAKVNTAISHLRRKLDPDPNNASIIQTIRRDGYRFSDPDASNTDYIKIRGGGKIVFLDERTAIVNGVQERFAPKETDLLNFFKGSDNGLATHEALSTALTNRSAQDIRATVMKLRRILGRDVIINIPGVGYRLRIEKIADKRTPSEDE
jgi:DNA-binding response OmpR family regulator